MPDMGIQRTLFQFDYKKSSVSLYFTNIGDNAFIGCILGSDFDYINVTVEAMRTAFILRKRLSRDAINPEEMNRFLEGVSTRASQSAAHAERGRGPS